MCRSIPAMRRPCSGRWARALSCIPRTYVRDERRQAGFAISAGCERNECVVRYRLCDVRARGVGRGLCRAYPARTFETNEGKLAALFQLDVNGTNVSFDTGYATSVLGALGAGFVVHTPHVRSRRTKASWRRYFSWM